jgi:hypothetical protein
MATHVEGAHMSVTSLANPPNVSQGDLAEILQSPPCPPVAGDGSDLIREQVNACLMRYTQLGAVLKIYTDAAQQRNVQLEKLNTLVGALGRTVATFPPDAKPTDTLDGTTKAAWGKDPKYVKIEREINTAFLDAGITHPDLSHDTTGRTSMVDKDGKPVTLPGGLAGGTTKGELEGMLTKLKGKIDSVGNSQQLELVQLQSLMSKRDESLTVATNLQKRNEDGIKSIIRNLL